MSKIWEFLKRFYEEAYDVPNFYLEIEDKLYCHVFTIFFILSIFLGVAYVIKMLLSLRETKEDRMKRKKKMEKLILGVLEEKDKNKKERNI
jgi:hypothetical protein